MNAASEADRRVLVVDDNRSIHSDFRKILQPPQGSLAAQRSEAALFGGTASADERPRFLIDSALQGSDAVECVRRAMQARQPYGVAFVDAHMPPGMDGLQTIARIWEIDPDVQVVLCTAHAECTWQQIRRQLPHPQQVVFLRKPFDTLEVLQLAESLSEKWELVRRERHRLSQLGQQLTDRNRDAQAMRKVDAILAGTTADAASESAATERRRLLERSLGNALEAGELTLHFQPLVEIASRRIDGLEALLRWRSPVLGDVSPGEFIPIAETTGMILPIGEFVMKEACARLAQWQREGISTVPVSINVSAMQIERQPFRDVLLSCLRESGLQPRQLVIELTETTLMKDADRHIDVMKRLRTDGVRLAIDDFGTGYSSLSYLRDLPTDTLKIDRSFTRHIDNSPSDEAIVSAILGMSRALGLDVVAEGVETAGQLETLARHGCAIAQGFYFSRPLPEPECRELLVELGRRASFTDTLRLRPVPASRRGEMA